MNAWTRTIFILVLTSAPALAQRPVEIAARVSAIHRNHPPQIHDAHRLFDQARPFEGNLRDGTILCRVSADSNRRYDGAAPRGPVSRRFGAPDLNVTLRVHQTRGLIHGPEDRYSTTVSMPGVSVRRGQRIGIHLVDRDAFRNDTVGDAVAVYGGSFPIELPGNQANGECRVLEPAIAERRMPGILANVDRELERATGVRVDLRANEIASPRESLDRALYHLYDAAALAGWQRTEVGNRRERVGEIERTYADALREAVAAARAAAPEPGRALAFADGRWEARITQADCNPSELQRFSTMLEPHDPRGCALRMELTTSRAGRFQPQVRALGRDGEMTTAVIKAREVDGALEPYSSPRLSAGTTHVLWVFTAASPDLVRLKLGAETVFLRVR